MPKRGGQANLKPTEKDDFFLPAGTGHQRRADQRTVNRQTDIYHRWHTRPNRKNKAFFGKIPWPGPTRDGEKKKLAFAVAYAQRVTVPPGGGIKTGGPHRRPPRGWRVTARRPHYTRPVGIDPTGHGTHRAQSRCWADRRGGTWPRRQGTFARQHGGKGGCPRLRPRNPNQKKLHFF